MSTNEDRGALFDLVARYALAVDRRDAITLTTLFAPDATMVLPEALGGSGAEEPLGDPARLVNALGRFERTRHTVAQQVVDIAGDLASGTTYAEAHHLYAKHGELLDFVAALRYLDEFARTDKGWCFTRRELAVDWTQRLTLTRPEPIR